MAILTAATGVPRMLSNSGGSRRRAKNGGFVEFCERDLRNTTDEESHTRASRADRGKRSSQLAKEKDVIHRRKQRFAIGEAEQFEDSRSASEPLQAGLLVKTQQTGGAGNEAGMRKYSAENELASDTRKERTDSPGIYQCDRRRKG